MILPIRTNIRPRRTPYANYTLIVANIIIFFLTYSPHINPYTRQFESLRPWAQQFQLFSDQWQWWQFITYAFLHANFWHIFGNMFFLYLFGNNVNDKLGHAGFLGFYLAGAAFSGIGHAALHFQSAIPTLGASGAVAAVTGAYLALFPQTLITVIYWFFFIGTIEVPALYFIAFKLILIDNVIARTSPYIAYDAHLAGYTFGIAATIAILATGLVTSSNFDLWAMIKRWNRRRQYRDAISSGYDPFTGRTTTKQIKVKEINKTNLDNQHQQKIIELRNEIASRILERNLHAAAELYLQLINLDKKQLLPRPHLLDIANQLASEKKHVESAQAYEQFLAHYSNYEYIEQVQLMLGILYSRYLNQRDLAVKYLQAAAEKLSDPGQLKMCQDELTRLKE